MNHCWNVRIFQFQNLSLGNFTLPYFGKGFCLSFFLGKQKSSKQNLWKYLDLSWKLSQDSFFMENLWIKSLRPLPRHHQCCGGFVRPYPRFTQLFRNFTGYLWKSQSVVRPETLYEENYGKCIFNAGLSPSWVLLLWK